ncbi:LuxR family transcriptional regulator [Streptomyces sp. NBC_00102]|uniref:helix-turn-helix transcriptional regulator n=1 Tax=Streptomyces sp. NBC_00102 TaxID=2975652 RepID=UPI002250EBF7|nr:LuxR family transcriptional regulator [Streptomyces sp. NBC_00102]MCX5401641.1 AAA family ATPase [Streptomyces sp. NBC_00102]
MSEIRATRPRRRDVELVVVFVERENQLTRLRELLADCLGGRGSVVAVSGPVAAGKTELLHVFCEIAAGEGAVVLHAAARCSEQDVPLGVVGQLFGREHFTAEERARALDLPEDGGSATCDADLLSDGPAPTRAGRIHWESVRALSKRVPVVLAVDDLHFADPASLNSLIHMGGLLRASRVLIVVTESDPPTDGNATERAWRTPLLRQRHFTRVRVRPLSPAATGRMLAGLPGGVLAPPAPDGTTASWHRLSGGNPLLLRALAEDWYERPGGPVGAREPRAGAEFGRAVDACVRRAGRRFRDAARALAVLDASGSHHRLARLLGQPQPEVDETLGAMDAIGVLDEGRYRHPAAGAAVLAGMPAAERSALHRAAARLLHGAGDPASAVAVHLLAGRHGDEPFALPVLLEAARESLRRDDTGFADACLALAADACADEEQLVTVTMLRSLVDSRSDPDTACRRLRPLVDALREGRLTGCQSVSLLGRLLRHGSGDEITLALGRLERFADTLDPVAASEYLAAREWLRASHPALLRESGPPFRTARAAGRNGRVVARGGRAEAVRAATDGTPRAMGAVLNGLLRSGPDQDTVRSAELALQSTPLDDEGFDTLHLALSVLVYADRSDLAVGWCDGLYREAAERGAPAWQALFAAVRAEIAVRQGDARLAERTARRAMSLMSTGSWGVLIGSPLSSLLLSATAAGTVPETGIPRTWTLPEQLFQTRYGVQYLHARGRQRLSLDLLHAALDDLTHCGRLLREWDIDQPAFVPWRSDAVTALLRLGRTDEARRLASEQLGLVSPEQPRARGMALRTAASVSDPRRRAALLRESADLLDAAGDRLELARALADLSAVHIRAGQTGRARMVARQAQEIAEEQGFAPLSRRLAAQESQAVKDDRETGVTLLSGSESQVAALAVAGHSNREIAEKLFITVSTVEQHLTHAYRKLRVKGRADLPSSLREHGRAQQPAGQPAGGRAREHTRPAGGQSAAGAGGTGSPSSPRSVSAS